MYAHNLIHSLSLQALRDRIEALEKHLDVEWGAAAGTGSIAELEQSGSIMIHFLHTFSPCPLFLVGAEAISPFASSSFFFLIEKPICFVLSL